MEALDMQEIYVRDGFLVLEDALTPGEVDGLRTEIVRICRGELGSYEGMVNLQGTESEEEIIRQTLAIHFPHKISDRMRAALSHPAVSNSLVELIGPNVKCMQSMLFIKSSGKPGQAWHQDELFIPTRDRSLTAAWVALDDAVVENGCLWVIPGSHRAGILWPQREQVDALYDCTDESYGFPYTESDAVPVEVRAGSIVFFNGYLLHKSLPNRATAGFRRVLVGHYMSAESFLPWYPPREGEFMGTADYRDILMIAGRDPYPYKGFETIHEPHVRPSGEGGCVR